MNTTLFRPELPTKPTKVAISDAAPADAPAVVVGQGGSQGPEASDATEGPKGSAASEAGGWATDWRAGPGSVGAQSEEGPKGSAVSAAQLCHPSGSSSPTLWHKRVKFLSHLCRHAEVTI